MMEDLIGKHLQFDLFGEYVGMTSFEDEKGKERHFLKLDYFGGSQAVELESADEVARFSDLPKGCEARLSGHVEWKAISPRLRVDSFSFAGSKGFRPLTVEERLSGSSWVGYGELLKRGDYHRSDGITMYSVYLKVFGGTVKMSCSDAVHAACNRVGMQLICRGCLMTALRYDEAKRSHFVELLCTVNQITELNADKKK